jgi:hypothetical protein
MEEVEAGAEKSNFRKEIFKSLRDRALLLMSKRKDVVNHQQKS